jgi:hypothetical protein
MDLDNIEKRFGAFLYSAWQLSDVAPFNLAYIRLLTFFKDELSEAGKVACKAGFHAGLFRSEEVRYGVLWRAITQSVIGTWYVVRRHIGGWLPDPCRKRK